MHEMTLGQQMHLTVPCNSSIYGQCSVQLHVLLQQHQPARKLPRGPTGASIQHGPSPAGPWPGPPGGYKCTNTQLFTISMCCQRVHPAKSRNHLCHQPGGSWFTAGCHSASRPSPPNPNLTWYYIPSPAAHTHTPTPAQTHPGATPPPPAQPPSLQQLPRQLPRRGFIADSRPAPCRSACPSPGTGRSPGH